MPMVMKAQITAAKADTICVLACCAMIYSFEYAGLFQLCQLQSTGCAKSNLIFIFSNINKICEHWPIEAFSHVGK